MKTAYLCMLALLLPLTSTSAEVHDEANQAFNTAIELAGMDPDKMHCPPFFDEDGSIHRDCYCPQPHDPLGICD